MSDHQISLEELTQRYVDAVEAEEEARFTQSAIAWSAREMGGKASLAHIASQAHRKAYRLVAQADTFDLVKLRETRPTLTWLHLNILATAAAAIIGTGPTEQVMAQMKANPGMENAGWWMLEEWADKVVDNEWTPADLRREIGTYLGGPTDDPSVIVKKAESSSEKLKKVVDEAVRANVLEPVVERVESAHKYAEARMKEAGAARSASWDGRQ